VPTERHRFLWIHIHSHCRHDSKSSKVTDIAFKTKLRARFSHPVTNQIFYYRLIRIPVYQPVASLRA
jgi:hypothetical protein